MNLKPYTEQIINEYENLKYTTTEIAGHIGCSQSGVERLLKTNGIEMHRTMFCKKICDEDRKKILPLYESGLTTEEIGNMYGVTGNIISRIVKENHGTVRAAKRRSTITNHDYFKSIDTKEKAYFLGLLITDGSVVNSKTRENREPSIRLELVGEDAYIIYKFAEEIGAKPDKVKFTKTREKQHAYIHFSSKEMAEDLAKYGCVPNKSWITYLPKIREDLMPHLIRGIFDGDGTVTIDKRSGKKSFAFYGSEKICTDIRNFFVENLNFRNAPVSKSTCYHVWWTSKYANDFAKYIYIDDDDLHLVRKKKKFYI